MTTFWSFQSTKDVELPKRKKDFWFSVSLLALHLIYINFEKYSNTRFVSAPKQNPPQLHTIFTRMFNVRRTFYFHTLAVKDVFQFVWSMKHPRLL